MKETVPDLTFETAVHAPPTIRHIAGLDEAGRGALAGPVVAAAVVLPLDNPKQLAHLADVNDSKQLKPAQREALFTQITTHVLAFGIGQTSAADIDQIGIIPATKRAMQQALAQMALDADYLLIDGRIRLPNIPTPQKSIVRGDGRSLSIAAASILAKVTRDRLMVAQDDAYPRYGFARHKGYGTEFHRAAISRHGPCPIHRYSFAPIRQPMV